MLIEQLETILPDYEKYLGAKNLSPKTVSHYKLLIRKYIEYLDNEYIKPPNYLENINEEQVLTFIEHKRNQGASVHNQDTYFKFIRYFFEFLYHEKTMKTLILQNIPGFVIDRAKYDREYGYFSIDELKKIVETARQEYEAEKSFSTYRDYLIIYIFTYAGLTLTELYNLDEEDIDFEKRKITIKGVKNGSKVRTIHLSKNLSKIIQEYLKIKHSLTNLPYLFVSRENNRLSVKAIQESVKRIMKKSNIEKKDRSFSPKTIRHTVIKTMIENETELPVICNITGLDIKTLYKYIEEFTTVADLKEELYLEDHLILAR